MNPEQPNSLPEEPIPNIEPGQEGNQSGKIGVIHDETVAPDTMKMGPNGIETTVPTTQEGLENMIAQGKTPTNEQILNVAKMEAARKSK